MGTRSPPLTPLLGHRWSMRNALASIHRASTMRRPTSSSSPSRSLQLGVARYTFVPEDRLKFVGLCGAQIVRDVLIRNGVQHAFAYSGGANIHLTDSICTDGRIKVFLPRHEQGAGHMAEGYARVTGRPGVVSVTSGPGATNVITPLQDAMSDGIPMIVIAGQVSAKDLGTGAFQDADIVGMTQPCTKWATMVECVEDLPAYVDEAFRVATSGRPGPVLLSIPRDVFEATWRDDHPIVRNITLPSYPAQIRPPPPRASEPPAPKIFGDISEAATRINNSKRPLIIAGAGLLSSPDGPRILSELAFRGNIPVATTLHGLGAFDEDHHLSLHMLGLHGSVYGNYAAQSADTIIVLGARLDERVTANIDGFAVAARAAGKDGRGGIIHFEIQPKKSNRIIDTHISVVGDVTENLKILEPLIEPRARAGWLDQIQTWKTEFPFTYEPSAPGQRVKPQEVIEELDKQTNDIKDRVLITTGVGHHQMWAAQFFTWKQPRSLITSGALATMGFGLPAAIGAKVADPTKIVVDIDGDASFLMSGLELATAAEYGVGVKVLIFNNNVQGMVYRWQKIFYGSRHTLTRMVNPDFVMLAQSMGVHAIQCETAEQLPTKMKEFLEYDNSHPIVMVCQVDEEEELYPIVKPGKALHELTMHPSLPSVQA
ncbi:Acetolactate synthase, mitochondrial [Pleurotus ostreatus]|uniref:Acetolactate synthase n=1 Tax=Pleurotus ostreatus TaxID=5322 RepID=A0A8H6ZS27_PLEOS|nr:Acetolactate synthase, mitochondrial [Pleurotus ostreatus]KAF7422512.1 Acetolactate synthase, mitochondrial [Pleurotus ostreatus]